MRFIEAVFALKDGGAVGEAGEVVWRENGRTIAPFLAMKASDPIDCQTLGTVRTPTLVVQGAESFTQFSIMAETVGSCVANGLTVTMPGVNHDGPYRKPEQLAAMIRHFIALTD